MGRYGAMLFLGGLSALLLSGCSAPPAPTITVIGVVTLGPFCPVQRPGVTCPVPPGAFDGAEAWARDGGTEVRAPLSPTGRFTLALGAGTWQVTATAGMSCGTATVTRSGPVSIECDTGIR
jgi:hypothetical protein